MRLVGHRRHWTECGREGMHSDCGLIVSLLRVADPVDYYF